MTEPELETGTIFVDVGTGQQYPILYTELLNQDIIVKNENEVSTVSQNIPGPKVIQNEAPEVLVKSQDAKKQGNNGPKTISPEETACLKIQQRRIKCPECQRYSAETEEKLLRHIRKVHRGENPFQCYMCDYSTYNKALFEEHVRIHQGIKPFKCSHCPYRSASKKNTKKHEQIHRPDNPLRCKQCDFIARNTRVLDHHRNVSHIPRNEPVAKCPLCPFEYKLSEIAKFRSHQKNRHKCEKCNYKVCSRSFLKTHMAMEHNVLVTKKTSPVFKCALCKWSSNFKPRILLHLIHHPKQSVDESVVDITILKDLGIM